MSSQQPFEGLGDKLPKPGDFSFDLDPADIKNIRVRFGGSGVTIGRPPGVASIHIEICLKCEKD